MALSSNLVDVDAAEVPEEEPVVVAEATAKVKAVEEVAVAVAADRTSA